MLCILFIYRNILVGCEIIQLKPGGSIPDKGKKISLVIKSARDLSRDVIKASNFFMLTPVMSPECIVSCILIRLVNGIFVFQALYSPSSHLLCTFMVRGLLNSGSDLVYNLSERTSEIDLVVSENCTTMFQKRETYAPVRFS